MKVPGSDIKDVVQTRTTETRKDKVSERQASSAHSGQVAGDPTLSAALEDTVQFSSLGSVLQSELDPTSMAQERRAKIESLKERIKNGTYQPPVEGVAQALAEEVSFEILLSGGGASETK